MTLAPAQGARLKVSAPLPLSMNALAFSYADLDRKPLGSAHSDDIRPRQQVTLLVDQRQAGVGGDDQWSKAGQPHPRYRLPLARGEYQLTLEALAAGRWPLAAEPRP